MRWIVSLSVLLLFITLPAFAEERVVADSKPVQVAAPPVYDDSDFPTVSANQVAQPAALSHGPAPRLKGCPTLQNPCGPDMVCSLSAGDCKGGFGTSCCSYIDDNGNGLCHSC